jgi:hypothetical protein
MVSTVYAQSRAARHFVISFLRECKMTKGVVGEFE